MTLYGIIYDFVATYIFSDTNEVGTWYLADFYIFLKDSGGNNIGVQYTEWLCHTTTIIAMCLIVAFAIWLVRWIFKAVSSAFLLRR